MQCSKGAAQSRPWHLSLSHRPIVRFDQSVMRITGMALDLCDEEMNSSRPRISEGINRAGGVSCYARTKTMTISSEGITPFETGAGPGTTPNSSRSRTIDRRLVHKSYDQNVLISHIETVTGPAEPEH